jgi:secreted PhoX family phosphatase
LPSASGGSVGDFAAAQAAYTVIDDLVVPPEYERYVIIGWGDRIYPDPQEYFGYNADYTAFVPRRHGKTDDGWLWVNHEYVSSPMSFAAPEAPASLASANPQVRATAFDVIGIDLDAPTTTWAVQWCASPSATTVASKPSRIRSTVDITCCRVSA